MERLLGVPISVFFTAAVVMAGLAVLPAQRWNILLRLSDGKFSTTELYRLVMIGNFLAQAMPSIGADGVRAWYVHRHGLPLTTAINSVLIDRLSALVSVFLLTLLSLPWLWGILPKQHAYWTIGLMLFAVIGGLAFIIGVTEVPNGWVRWRVVAWMQQLSGACRGLIKNGRALTQVISLSLTVQLLIALFLFALANAVRVPVGLADCILLIPLVMLVSTLPVSIAGWGVREGAMILAFDLLNILPSDALFVSILFGIVVAISTIPGLIFWFMVGRDLKIR